MNNESNLIVTIIGFFLGTIVAYLISHYMGRKRTIGFWWSLFFCFFLSPFGGLIIVLLHRKTYLVTEPVSVQAKTIKIIFGILILALAAFNVLEIINGGFSFTIYTPPSPQKLFVLIGMIGLGVYLLGINQAKSNNALIVKNEQSTIDSMNNTTLEK